MCDLTRFYVHQASLLVTILVYTLIQALNKKKGWIGFSEKACRLPVVHDGIWTAPGKTSFALCEESEEAGRWLFTVVQRQAATKYM